VAPLMYQFPGPLFELLAGPIDLEKKRAILGGNARTLLGMEPWMESVNA